MAATQSASYRRQKSKGTLTLNGVVDIFEAETLKSQAMRALDDANAESVAIDLTHLESVDITALQVLLALQNGVVAAGRKFVITNPPPAFTKTLVELDLATRL